MTSTPLNEPAKMHAGDDFAAKLVDWNFKYRIWILIVCIGLTIAGITGALRSGFNTDARVYFGLDNPERLALEAMEARHGRYNTAILIFAPASGDVFSISTLNALNEATMAFGAIPGIAAIQSLANIASPVLDGEMNQPLLAPGIPVSEKQAAFVKSIAPQIRAQSETLLSESGHVTAINMLIGNQGGAPERQMATVEKLQDLKAALAAQYPAIDFHLTGSAVLDKTFMEAIQNDLLFLVPFQIAAIIGLLLVCLQSILVSGVLLMVLGVTTALTMGIAGWLGHDLNGVTSTTPMVLMGLAIATSIHLLLSWQQELRHGNNQIEALKLSVRINFFPIFLAALTTMISFLCLNFSDSPPFRQMGNLVAVGILITFILAFTLLPALTSFLPPKPARSREKTEQAIGRLGAWVTRTKPALIALFAITLATSVWGVNRLVFDDNFAHYFSEDYEFRRSTDFLEENLSGLTVIEFSLPTETGIADPDYLNDLDRFASWLRDQPKVTHVASLLDIFKSASAAIPFIETENDLPVSATDSEMVWEFLRQNLAEGALQGRPVNVEETHSLLTAILSDASSSEIREFSKTAETWLTHETPSLAAPATGMSLLAANMSIRNTRAMVTGTIVALVLVSLILLVALRSFSLGLVSLIPNLMPMMIAYGLWGLAIGEISFAATVVSAMTFGIVVDDTVHFLWKYRYARDQLGLSPAKAIPQAFSTVGVAILVTTLAIVSGFAALAFSGFLVNAHLGLLTVMTLLAALLAVLLFLPTFLLVLERGD